MIRHLTLRGGRAEILLSYQSAALISSWRIFQHDDQWTLKASVVRVNAFVCRQKPLLFASPRAGGFWCWPVLAPPDVVGNILIARLGPPEQ